MKKICIIIVIVAAVVSCSEKASEKSVKKDNSQDSVYFDLLQRATSYLQSGKLEKAELTLSQAENIEPKLPMAYYMHGILYYNQRDIDNSSRYFTKALQRCNDEEMPKLISDIDSLTSLPETEEEDELIKEALKTKSSQQRSLLERALEKNSFNSTTYFLLAENYKEAGNRVQALDLYNKTVRLHPAHKGALAGLSELYKGTDEKLYKTILKTRMRYFGVQPEIRHMLASVYYEENSLDDAVMLLERNTKEYPDYYQSYFLLGKIYVEQKKKDMARQKLVVFSDEKEEKYFSKVLTKEEYKEYKQRAHTILSEM